MANGNVRAATVIGIMIAIGVVLRIVQEARADTATAAVDLIVHVMTRVTHDGVAKRAC